MVCQRETPAIVWDVVCTINRAIILLYRRYNPFLRRLILALFFFFFFPLVCCSLTADCAICRPQARAVHGDGSGTQMRRTGEPRAVRSYGVVLVFPRFAKAFVFIYNTPLFFFSFPIPAAGLLHYSQSVFPFH